MIIMTNTYCHEGYCEPTLNREDSHKLTLGDKALIGGYVLVAVVVSALVWYGASQGIYVDPAAVL
jgi:hypothetical protein